MNYTYLKSLLIILFCTASISVKGQPIWQWGKTTVDIVEGRQIATDKRSNIFIAGFKYNVPATVGTTTLAANIYPMVWIKYDANGNPVFADGIIGNSQIHGIATDTGGNLIIFGEISDDTLKIGSYIFTTVFNASDSNNYHYFVAKVSPTGTVLWAKKGGLTCWGSNNSLTYGWGKHVATDDTGNIYIGMQFKMKRTIIETDTLVNADTSGATTDILLAKYTPSGTFVWARSAGGTGYDFVNGLIINTDGNIYITGDFCSPSIRFGDSMITSAAHNKAYIAAFSPSGDALRAITTNNTDNSAGIDISHDNYGNIYLVGSYYNGRISFDTITHSNRSMVYNFNPFLYKFTNSLHSIWGRTIYNDGPVFNSMPGQGVIVTPCGVVINVDAPSGHIVFSNTDSIYLDSAALYAGIIVDYDFSGNLIYHNMIPSRVEQQNMITSNNIGDIFLTGSFHDTLTIGHDTLRAVPRIWPMQYLVAKYGLPVTIKATKKDTIWCLEDSLTLHAPTGMTGYMWNDGLTTATRKVDGNGTYWVACTNCHDSVLIDSFIIKDYDSPCEGIVNHVDNINEIIISPNPVSEIIKIETGSVALKSASIINNIGQVVQSIVLTGNHTRVNVATLPPGLYTIRLMGQDGVVIVKFVKE